MSDYRKARRSGVMRPGGMPIDPNSQVASKLKAFYAAVEQEPIPDMFLDLLEQLDKAEKAGKA
ncbi:hypothetical protein BJF93_05510 [Xaviernesmea oryzae]|uniref:Anti-sigma factor NepR domain-containing protein n=2 Tax=Xaviernesmea oryzae TaxID=464029 RepID=A0A1Q9ART1_9HYPH|nr:hypothetical protein BJF93_05510 [Xaviernesmea oryzae]